MESSDQARKIISFLLFFMFLGILGWAVWRYVSSPLLQRLARYDDVPVHLVILTEPATQISYNPALHKAVVTMSDKNCEREKMSACFGSTPNGYFIPAQTDQERFWQDFKYILSRWRYNPLLLGKTAGAYAQAVWQKRTDLNMAEFAALGLALSRMQTSDFTLTYPVKVKTKKTRKQPVTVQVSADKLLTEEDNKAPLKVEILNASGNKGLAKKLTQYLRHQYAQGLLNVDVMQYDNYPARKDKTEVIDYSGRIIPVSKLTHTIGFKGEVKAETSSADIYDTRIILGKDFEMPL